MAVPVIEVADCTETYSSSPQSSWVINHPAYSDGDLLLVTCGQDLGNGTITPPATGPNGETINGLGGVNFNTATSNIGFYWVGSGSASAGTITVTSGGSQDWGAVVVKVPAGEFDVTTPVDSYAIGGSNSIGANASTPALSVTNANCRLVTYFTVNIYAVDSASLPTGWTELINRDIGDHAHFLGIRDSGTSSSESVSAVNFPLLTSERYSGIIYAVNEPSTSAFTSTVAAAAPAVTSSVSASHAVPAFTSTVSASLPAVESSTSASHTIPSYTSTVAASIPAVTASLSAAHVSPENGYSADAATGCKAAYGLRKMSAAFVGNCLRIRRSSDDTEQDIGFSGDDLDTSSLETFCSGTDGYIVTLYDQSGNGDDITQVTSTKQPLLVSSGSVLTNHEGKHYCYCVGDELEGTLTASVSSHDVTLFVVANHQDALFDNNTSHAYAAIPGVVSIGGYPKVLSLSGGGATHEQYWGANLWPVIHSLSLTSSTFSYWRNRWEAKADTHAVAESTSATMRVGDDTTSTGYGTQVSEVVVYPSLSESERLAVYDAINFFFDYGPTDVNSGALLPQRLKWQVELYDWMETLSESDFDVTLSNLTWDGTYGDLNELSKLWVFWKTPVLSMARQTYTLRNHSKWWVLDDGAGHGVEGSGSVCLQLNKSTINGDGGRAQSLIKKLALLHELSLPLSGGGEGNPYYHHTGVLNRLLVSMAVSFMMNDAAEDDNNYYMEAPFMGGSMNDIVAAYNLVRSQLSAGLQNTWDSALRYKAKRFMTAYAWPANGNIDIKAIESLAGVYSVLAGDADAESWCIKSCKRILFGDDTLTPTTSDHQKGVYNPAGFVTEGLSAETTYNGWSLMHMAEAMSYVLGDSNWDWLDEICEQMVKYKMLQYLSDGTYTEGPTCYSSRTSGSYVKQQASDLFREIFLAGTYTEAIPLIRNYSGGMAMRLEDASTMVTTVTNAVSAFNATGITTPLTDDAPIWEKKGNGDTWWTAEGIYYPADGWYATLKALADLDDQSTYPVFSPQSTVASVNQSLDDEWWVYKASDGTRDFGFMVEAQDQPGDYYTWTGGCLCSFWREDVGMVVLGRVGDGLRRNWDEIRKWAVHHIWGIDDEIVGGRFSDIASRKDGNLTRSGTFNLGAGSPNVVFTHDMGLSASQGTNECMENGNELEGGYTVTKTFTAISSGVQIRHQISVDSGTDQVTELWLSLPIFRLANGVHGAESTIDYWTGSAWSTLPTTTVETTSFRIGQDIGSGYVYSYITVGGSRPARLSDSTFYYGSQLRCTNIEIDLHGSPGNAIAFPTVDETISITTEPILTAFYGDVTANTPAVTSAISATMVPPNADAAVAATVPAVTSASSAAHTVPNWAGWTIAATPAVTAAVSASHVPANWDASVTAPLPAVTSAAVAEATTTPEDYTATVACTLPAVVAEINARKGSRRKRPTIIDKQRGATINGEWL